jgi:phage tail-like protein
MSRKVLTACVTALFVFAPMPLLAQRMTPLQSFTFSLIVTGDRGSLGYFQQVSGLSSESTVVEYRSGNEGGTTTTQKIPGVLKWGDITLKRGITADLSLAMWRKLVEDGDVQAARQNGSIVLLNASMQPVATWTFVNGWPSKYEVEIDPDSGQPMEVLVLAVEGIHRQ